MGKRRRAHNGNGDPTTAAAGSPGPEDPPTADAVEDQAVDAVAGVATSEEGATASNRRAWPRAPIEAAISLTSQHNLYAGIANDISEGGVFVATYQPLPVGAEVAIDLSFEAVGGPRLLVNGEVRWHRGDTPSGDAAPGMGLRFLDLREEARQWIAEFVRQREPEFFDDPAEGAANRRVLPTAELAAATSRGTGAAAHSKLWFGLGLAGLLGLVFAVALTMFRGPTAPPPRALPAAARVDDRSAAVGAPNSPAAATRSDEATKPPPGQAAPVAAAEAQPQDPAVAPASAAPPAVEPGMLVAARLRPCFPGPTTPIELKVALFVQPTGKVVRGFVTTRRGAPLAPAVTRCTRDALRALALPLTLPRAGFVEWTISLTSGGARAKLIRPRSLAR